MLLSSSAHTYQSRYGLDTEESASLNPVSAAFLAQAEHAVPMPNIPQMPVVWDPMGTALSVIWNEEKDPKEALDQAVKQIQDAIEGQ